MCAADAKVKSIGAFQLALIAEMQFSTKCQERNDYDRGLLPNQSLKLTAEAGGRTRNAQEMESNSPHAAKVNQMFVRWVIRTGVRRSLAPVR